MWRTLSGDAVERPFVSAPLELGTSADGESVVESYALTPLQQSMLIQAVEVQRDGADIEQIVMDLPEELHVPAFRDAWWRAAERHAILRTVFSGVDGTPRQHVRRRIAIPWVEADWRGLSARERKRRFGDALLADRARPFDLECEPAIRLMLIREEERSYRFVWTFHHIAMDGRGIFALLSEVFARYEAMCANEAWADTPATRYGDFVSWQQRQDWTAAESYWRAALQGFSRPTPLGFARITPRALEPAAMRGEQSAEISSDVTAALNELARSNGVTTNTLVQGAWAIVLSRFSGEDDVVFGAVRACRHGTIPGADQLVGMCINTVPVRLHVPATAMIVPWLQELREQWVALRQFEHTPLAKIQSWSECPPGRPIFESLVNFQDPSWDAALHALGGKWRDRGLSIVSQPSVPIVLDGYGGSRIKLTLLYDRRRVDNDVVARLLVHLTTVLEAIAVNPHRRLADVPLMPEEEGRRLIADFNRTRTKYPRAEAVHRVFEKQARATPDALALAFEGQSLTYRALNERANQLAHDLRARGVREGTLVGICIERSLEMVIGILGILKAGGAYVPLDPSYPQERLAFMLEDTRTPILLTLEAQRGKLPHTNADILCLDTVWPAVACHDTSNVATSTNGDSLAYVIYTSGSTGKPKGACVPHRGIVRLVKNPNFVRLDANETFLQFAPISFDASTFEIWGSLLNGAKLVIFPPARPSLQQLGEIIEKEKITTLWLTAALFQHMIEHCCDKLQGVRQLLAGGDVLPIGAVRKALAELKNTRLINGYGPTENTTFTCCHTITEVPAGASSVPIGRPIANTTAYILDSNLRPVPIGVPGELWTGGDGLATGYLNHPELTAERFRPDPFSREIGARMYRTGDQARWLPDGTIEFLGRIDQQVKIRGFRIELGEIETALAQHPAVREVCVIAREDTPGDKRLVAYVVLRPEANGVIDRPRQFVKQKLPEYMVPAAVVVLDALPLSPNGKVDRKALPRPERIEADARGTIVAPRTLMEQMVAGVWEDVLKVDRVGVQQNFFEHGGDSLLATVFAVRLGKTLGIDVPVSLIFDHPTLAELSARLESLRSGKRGAGHQLVTRAPRGQLAPLSVFQRQIWDYCQAADPLVYTTHIHIRLDGPVDAAILQRSLTEVVRRHEVLRTVVGTHDGQLVQVVQPAEQVPLAIFDLTNATDAEAEIERIISADMSMPFDLNGGPLFRTQLVLVGENHVRFMIMIHHFIYDGSVREVFFHELGVLYDAYLQGRPSPLPEPTLQYRDFSVWQARHVQRESEAFQENLRYWKAQCTGAHEPLRLSWERPKPAVQNLADATRIFPWFPEGLCLRLGKLSHREGATLFMTLLAGFKTLLHHDTGRDDITIGTYVASRNHPEIDGMIGLKTNLVLLRTRLDGNPTFRELLRRVRETTLDAYTHQDVPFGLLSQALQADGCAPPPVQIIFQHVRVPEVPLSLPGVKVEFVYPSEKKVMPWGFSLNFMQCSDDHVVGGLSFDTDLYDPDGVQRMIPAYVSLLERIAANPDVRLAELRPTPIAKAA
jgi:amino acid adenylation domain-containing protein